MKLTIDNTFTKELPADAVKENKLRQVSNACFSFVEPTPCSAPSLIHVSDEMLQAVGISKEESKQQDFLNIFSGNKIYPGTTPYAMCYAGHQFGNWAGQLGDGRAINLFEVINDDKRWALQLKGAGKTPYSRTADGLAVLRSSIREYLCSEAMHYLGVPTTRALSLILTGDQVLRDVMYNGNPAYEKGAIVCRVSPSFIRFGNFEMLTARQELENLQQIVDYTINYFYPHINKKGKEAYLQFFEEVASRTMEMIVHWERVGFVHGVMNTDNMSILGLTIDYGPYGWLEDYDPNWTPNTTDAQGRRYRFGNQGRIALWNLLQLANALYPLIEDAPALENILHTAQDNYVAAHKKMFLAKAGLQPGFDEADTFIKTLKDNLYQSQVDYTLFFRSLADYTGDDTAMLNTIAAHSYAEDFSLYKTQWEDWMLQYKTVLATHGIEERNQKMNSINPKYVLRNYMAQLAIDAADAGNYSLIDELFQLLKQPYAEQPDKQNWFAKRPAWAKNKVGCSMLSCSS